MSTSAGKILIVDDDAKLRRALHSTLHTLGFEIAESLNGEQALREAKIQKFDLVLLDINMPGMGGIEACRELRRAFPRLQIVMLTVRDSEQDKVQALDAGADDYVTKPFSMRELMARIRAAIRRAAASVTEMRETIVIGEIELDPMRRTVRKAPFWPTALTNEFRSSRPCVCAIRLSSASSWVSLAVASIICCSDLKSPNSPTRLASIGSTGGFTGRCSLILYCVLHFVPGSDS